MHRINSCKFNCIKVHKSRKTAVINSIFCYIYNLQILELYASFTYCKLDFFMLCVPAEGVFINSKARSREEH